MLTNDIWTVTESSVRLSAIRSDIDGVLGTAVDYDRTADGAYTLAAAELAFRVEQGVALALSAMLLSTGPRAAVVARALEARLTPGTARAAEYLVAVAGSGIDLREDQAVVDNFGRAWTIVSAYQSTVAGYEEVPFVDGELTTLDNMAIRIVADVAGEIVAPSTFAFSPPIVGLTLDPGSTLDYLVSGRDEESTAALRLRVQQAESRPNGSRPGLHAALMDLPAVVAVSLSGGAGELRVGVALVSPSLSDLHELATTIYGLAPATATLLGTESYTIEDVTGRPLAIPYDTLSILTVPVDAKLITDGTVTSNDAKNAAAASLLAYGSTLEIGDTARVLLIQRALAVPGVVGLQSLTVDGGLVDVVPDATEQIVLAPTITVAP